MICCVWLLVAVTCVLKYYPILRAIPTSRVCACIYNKLWSKRSLIHHENKSAMVLLSNVPVTDVHVYEPRIKYLQDKIVGTRFCLRSSSTPEWRWP